MQFTSCIIFKNCTVFLKLLIRYWILNYLTILFLSQIHKITAPVFHAWYKLSSHTQLGFLFQFILYSSIKDNLIGWIVISYLFASEIGKFLTSPSQLAMKQVLYGCDQLFCFQCMFTLSFLSQVEEKQHLYNSVLGL